MYSDWRRQFSKAAGGGSAAGALAYGVYDKYVGGKMVKVSTGARVNRPYFAPRRTQTGRRTRRFSGYAVPGGDKKEVKALVNSTVTAAPGGGVLALNTTGSMVPLNLIQAGSSFFNRVGRKVMLKSVRLTGQISFTAHAIQADCDYARIIVFYDRQTNGTLPTIANILQDTDQAGTNTSNALCGINLDNRDRFKIIIDKRVFLPTATTQAGFVASALTFTNQEPLLVDEFRKLTGLETHYKADSAPSVIGDIATGGLFLCTLTYTNAAGSENYLMDWNARLRYTD